MSRQFFFLVFVFSISFFIHETSFASYVLPYPSAMPGSSFYRLHTVYDKLLSYWYFGDFGQFTYNLKESDNYLVQARVLFEYNQYLLGFSALQKSNLYFKKLKPNLVKAKNHNKNISEKDMLLKEASKEHIEVLLMIKQGLPKKFTWIPENDLPTNILLWQAIDNSVALRKTYE